jgi:hypothetical protein
MIPYPDRKFIWQATEEYEIGRGGSLCVMAELNGYCGPGDYGLCETWKERQEVRFMFAYLMLLVTGEEK